MYPILFELDRFVFKTAYLFDLLGAIAGFVTLFILTLGLNARKRKNTFLLSVVIFIPFVIGARLGGIVTRFLSGCAMSGGGDSLWWGLGLSVLCAFPAAKYLKIDVWETADLYAPAMAIGGVFVKLGCFFNGCCFGTPCPADTPFAVQFPFTSAASQIYPDVPLYPAQLYESLAWLVTFIILILYRKRAASGRQIALLFLSYGIFRFIIEYFRHNESIHLLTFGQWWALLAILLAIFVWIKRKPV